MELASIFRMDLPHHLTVIVIIVRRDTTLGSGTNWNSQNGHATSVVSTSLILKKDIASINGTS